MIFSLFFAVSSFISFGAFQEGWAEEEPSYIERTIEQQTFFNYLHNVTELSALNFLDLPISEHEKDIIYKIITTMADKSTIRLAFDKRSMEKKGKKIHHVHPFRFLGYVFSEPKLRQSMREIRKSHFKWNGFIDGLSKKMRNEANQNNLMPYVISFSAYLNVNPQHVYDLVQQEDYEGLVQFLIP